MITYWNYQNSLEQKDEYKLNSWINITEPSREEVESIFGKFNIPLDLIDDMLDIDERSRAEMEGKWLVIIYRIPVHMEDKDVPFFTIPLGILVSKNDIITICQYENEAVTNFINNAKFRNTAFIHQINFILHMFNSAARSYLKFLKQINAQTALIEKDLMSSTRNRELHNLLTMEKCLVYFMTSIKANDLLITKLRNSKFIQSYTYDEDLLEDLIIENTQALEVTNIYSSIQSGMMDAFASIISNNLNVIMKRLTSVTIILMIPTLIASLYGMNIPNFMEHNNYAFGIIIIISIFLSGIGALFFRRNDWF